MNKPAPWSIKGIKSGNREAAKELASKSGLTIGEWINSLIEDADKDDNSDAQNNAINRLKKLANSQENNNSNKENDNKYYSQENIVPANSDNITNNWSNFNTAQRESSMPLENTQHSEIGNVAFDGSRLANAMDALNRKLDSLIIPADNIMQSNSVANKSLYNQDDLEKVQQFTERAIDKLISKVDNSNKNSEMRAQQLEEAITDIKQAHNTIQERISGLEKTDPSNKAILSMRKLENALAGLAEQMSISQTRTQKIEEEIIEDRKTRLTPQDVERILSENIGNINKNVEVKIDEISDRLSSIEEIATQSIEQTDKGIGLLSDRVKDNEAYSQKTNETLREALVDLSARLNTLEADNIDGLKVNFDKKFGEFAHRIAEFDNNMKNIVENSKEDLETKFLTLASELSERIGKGEKDSLNAIENMGSQLLNTAQSLDERVKAIEEINNSAKDAGLAMRIELGRISHAIDERLIAIESREGGSVNVSDDKLTQLSEYVTNKLDIFEEQAEILNHKINAQNDALQEKFEQSKKDLENIVINTELKINQKLDDAMGHFTTNIKNSNIINEEVIAPINTSLNNLMNRLDTLELRSGESLIANISPPLRPTNAIGNSIKSFANEPDAPNNQSIGFGSTNANFNNFEDEIQTSSSNDFGYTDNNIPAISGIEDHSNLGSDFADLAQLSYPNQASKANNSISNEKHFELALEDEFEQFSPEEQTFAENPKSAQNDFLSRARQAAIEAAQESNHNNSKKKISNSKKKGLFF